MKIIKAHSRRVTDLAFSPDGSMLVSSGIDRTVRVWDMHAGTERILVPAKGSQSEWVRVAFTADGHHILGRSTWHHLNAWNVTTGHQTAVLLRPGAPQFSFGGNLAVSSTRDFVAADERVGSPAICLWNTRTWEKRVLCSGDYPFVGLALNSAGTRLATGFGVFDVDTGDRLSHVAFDGTSLEWSPTAPLVASSGYGSSLSVENVETDARVADITLGRTHVQDFAFSPDGRFLAVVSNGASVRVWETHAWTEQRELAWGIGPLKCIAFARDGLRAACGSESGRILIWDWDL